MYRFSSQKYNCVGNLRRIFDIHQLSLGLAIAFAVQAPKYIMRLVF